MDTGNYMSNQMSDQIDNSELQHEQKSMLEITGYKCSCGKGTIKKTTEVLINGTNKIGVYPCEKCNNHPHLFALKNYDIVGTIIENKKQ